MNMFLSSNKKAMQLKYKEMLDQQRQVKDQFMMYGNMSSVEKALNKNELQAYKNYDARQFALVPGIQHYKHTPQNESAKASDLAVNH
mmetsp:Transcript_726/g.903  ORF Transcript_726/g.903 Transcript_726/m.903 type:complete len:87 (+) Transcript_726:987-1247(+)|eukprot:CAMPEP_0170487924 /NCGR_PEP_ID=MMETSP0208-20121228/6618_1 /TAXON_ID=197538 /ORGANISM="Strombidium inclinatum, Strain S3" /LENGTH=86 /DNA_ID=CAMNT_0010762355 /DNA_START=918 /DNA_END=1178 /DNA_ORIENTATION=-